MAYAEKTSVPVTKSKGDIEKCVYKYGAENFGIMRKGSGVIIAFTISGRNIMFRMTTPENAQEERSIWRAMLLSIKSKLESAERGIETLDQAFLAQIVAPDGQTYGDHMIPSITSDYYTKSIPLLPSF